MVIEFQEDQSIFSIDFLICSCSNLFFLSLASLISWDFLASVTSFNMLLTVLSQIKYFLHTSEILRLFFFTSRINLTLNLSGIFEFFFFASKTDRFFLLGTPLRFWMLTCLWFYFKLKFFLFLWIVKFEIEGIYYLYKYYSK